MLNPFDDGERQSMVVPLGGGSVRRVCSYSAAVLLWLAWAPDGRSLVYAHPNWSGENSTTDVRQVSVDAGQPRRLLIAGSIVRGLAILPDGRHLAYVATTKPTPEVWLLENLLPKAEKR